MKSDLIKTLNAIEHPILEERTYPVPPNMRLLIEHGDRIEAGSE